LPELEYSQTNDEKKLRTRTDKLKVCSTSLFRPVVRNTRYKEYYNGIFIYLDSFSKFYPLTDGWILRVYIDASLFSNDYSYSNNSNIKSWDGDYESVKWRQCVEKLKEARNVQIIRYECPQFKDPAHPDYHLGYFGSIARFFSMFDSDVDITIFRNLNKNVLECDKLSVYHWIQTDKKFHVYTSETYRPPHFSYYLGRLEVVDEKYTHIKTGNKKYIESAKKLRSSMLAGLWGARHVNDLGLWNMMVEDLFCEMNVDKKSVEKCFDENNSGFAGKDLRYGIDEIILNGAIFNYMLQTDSLLLQPIYFLLQIRYAMAPDQSDYFNEEIKKKAKELGVELDQKTLSIWNFHNRLKYDSCDDAEFYYNLMKSTEHTEKYAEVLYHVVLDNPDKICMKLLVEHTSNIGGLDKLLIWEYLLAKPGEL